jgi:small subunit ribosomal protein S9
MSTETPNEVTETPNEVTETPEEAAETPDEAAATETAVVETGEAEAPEAAGAPVLDIGSQAAAAAAEPQAEPVVRGRLDKFGVAMGTGRRKTAVARVRISDGDGGFTVNEREMTAYFPLERDQQMILAPLRATDMQNKVSIWVRVHGGGPTGQTGAVVLGVARALEVKKPSLHSVLSDGGYLTRDGRMVERKKYGKKKARRSFQFSKR